MRRLVPLAALIVVAGLAVQSASSAAAGGHLRACSSYPQPGDIAPAGTRTPAAVKAEYPVLGRAQRAADRLGRSQLSSSLSASGIILPGIRFVGRAPLGGRAYLVPAEHLLAYRLVPPRCLPPLQRPPQRSLLPFLRREYHHRALCLVIIRGKESSPTCGRAPGTVDPLLFGPGSPAFGIAPDGISTVTVQFSHAPTRRARVENNFWILNGPARATAACGVSWLDARGTVLRVARSCSRDVG